MFYLNVLYIVILTLIVSLILTYVKWSYPFYSYAEFYILAQKYRIKAISGFNLRIKSKKSMIKTYGHLLTKNILCSSIQGVSPSRNRTFIFRKLNKKEFDYS